ncbi:MAG: protoporphyrinogen oxidase HemJ [Alphaproteobacteria bacterium]
MDDFLASIYLWVKALHVIAVISWMAGMLYLPRLFVYHTQVDVGSAESERFKVMEHKLMRVIINPAMVVTWLMGLTMVFTPGIIDWTVDIWFHVKFTLVILLSGVHGMFSKWRKDFAADQNQKSEKFFRLMNEAPTLMMIAIVIMVIVRPF